MIRAIIVLVALLLAVPPAQAVESHFGPAYEGHPSLGPGKVKGAVIYNHGKSFLAEPNTSIPAYVDQVRRAGWDVFSLVRPLAEDNVYDSTQALLQAAKQLKAQGYERVVSLGQSYGGWITIAAAAEEDRLFHAIVVTAPAAYGSAKDSTRMKVGSDWQRNGEIVSIAKEIKSTPVMAFFFAKDDYDPGGRGPALKAVLAARGFRHAVIDQPEGLSGHGAARSAQFAGRYGACIADFLNSPQATGAFDCTAKAASLFLPDEARPLSVSSGTPANIIPFLGTWSGMYPNGREVMFAVEKVDGTSATAIYAWGGKAGKDDEEGGWDRITGQFIGDKLQFESRKRVLLFGPQPNGQLEIVWAKQDGSKTLKASLHRLP